MNTHLTLTPGILSMNYICRSMWIVLGVRAQLNSKGEKKGRKKKKERGRVGKEKF